ncbi:hydrogenase iron-sulfur subunit [Desulfoprunum benzoelyticum]|uniref:Quinone-modifying oxidoreductase subunit QmoB n=1 Tax=Desulfoprunum benzoelyticum TaxID=1506996 RepID=A0A840UZX5_9BACT|nr:hydrogenase iron-sulfur subunit [Desulfoprunum benzoelyticum]MBB5348994.1 quinone-modifying oxidoreductase subunit QmoB [Desulfoprunum benzoelyticum]MBM9528844.1 hydrogenase iron-sulfur subunit [Desulfoprunum benzoelyticum]
MSKKYCAYLCSGCGIGDALDLDELNGVVANEMSMECKVHSCMCGADGRGLIQKDIEEGVNAIVIGACSPRVMTKEFDFGEDKIVVRANLREQVIWSEVKPVEGQEPHKEAAAFLQETAADYMRMACTRAKKTELPEPYKLETINKTIMVMGGGIAGLTAASEASAAGYQVLLVEKEDKLGGKAIGWRKSFPTKAPWTDLEENPVDALIAKVTSDRNISIKTGTEVARIGGAPGNFAVSFKPTGAKTEWDAPAKVGVDEQDLIDKGQKEDPNAGLKKYTEVDPSATIVGSVVLATGWKPADVSKYEHLGYGAIKNVVTNVEFEQLAKAGKVPANVAFIQSPGGAEDDKDFPYCNSVTSMVALKQAQYVCSDNQDGKAYILYQHMRTPGHMELFYKSAQQNNGIFMTKANVTKVEEKTGKLAVVAENTLLGENLVLDVDMVVLAAGMEPTTLHENTINLAYRQGPAFSDLDLFDGYADSHFICFPYETRRTGIYTCGGVRKAETIEETIDDATGAALKAIQCLESTDRGVSVHPRSGDATYPEFFMQRCTQCKRCTEECPFGALDDDAKGTPLPNPTRCRRCGTCMGACPERIIGFKDYNIDLIGSMVKAIEVPEDDEDRLRIIVFACENDAYPALDMSGMKRNGLNHMIRVIPVRCLGSVNMAWIRDALSAGMDGAMLLGCTYGDNYQCHFVKGSEIANKRMENIGDTLSSLGLESERCAAEQVAITDYDKIPAILNDFVDQIVEMGPNPFKGF